MEDEADRKLEEEEKEGERQAIIREQQHLEELKRQEEEDQARLAKKRFQENTDDSPGYKRIKGNEQPTQATAMVKLSDLTPEQRQIQLEKIKKLY